MLNHHHFHTWGASMGPMCPKNAAYDLLLYLYLSHFCFAWLIYANLWPTPCHPSRSFIGNFRAPYSSLDAQLQGHLRCGDLVTKLRNGKRHAFWPSRVRPCWLSLFQCLVLLLLLLLLLLLRSVYLWLRRLAVASSAYCYRRVGL